VCVCSCSTNHYSEHVIDHTELPRQLIKSALGEYLLQQTQPKVHTQREKERERERGIDRWQQTEWSRRDGLFVDVLTGRLVMPDCSCRAWLTQSINQSINQSISLIATLRPESRIAN